MRKLLVPGLVAVLLGLVSTAAAGATEDGARTTSVVVRVWQQVEDGARLYVSTRDATGTWGSRPAVRVRVDDDVDATESYQIGNALALFPLEGGAVMGLQVRLWQHVENPAVVHLSARGLGGSWSTAGTNRLPLESGHSAGRYRYTDITIDVDRSEYLGVQVPGVAIEFEGEFPDSERASLEDQFEREFARVATFFAHTYGVTAEGLTIVMERPGEGAAYGSDRIFLSDRFEDAIAHEYVHALQDQLSSGPEPGWMGEGVATSLELRYDEVVGNRTVEEGIDYFLGSARFYKEPLKTLEAVVVAAEEYAVSLLAVERLVERAGDDALIEFYRRLEAGTPWQSTFADVFGVTVEAFYEAFEPYRLEVAPHLLYFRGIILGPDGEPVEGLKITAIREGEIFSWGALTDAEGNFDLPAESFLNSGFVTVLDDDGNPVAGNDAAPVVMEMRTGNCEVFGYVGPNGNMVEHREQAREFFVESTHITGIVINLPIDPWSIPVVTGCGTVGIDLDGDDDE